MLLGYPQDITQRLKYFFQNEREKSFTSWVYDSSKKCNIRNLAEAGFFFVDAEEESDTVMCFYCGKTLDGWEEDDDPWTEHINHSTKCKFANLQTPEEALTVEKLLELIKEFLLKITKDCFDLMTKDTKKYWDKEHKRVLK